MARVAEEVENVALAPLSQTHIHETSSSSKGSTRITGEKNEKLSKVEKRLLDWNMKQALSGSGGKLTSFDHSNGANDGSRSPGEFKSSAVIRALEGLPGAFCKSHLPDKDVSITLEDESGKNYQVKYIAYKTGLGAGWRQFSVAHKLLEGDALVFQFIKPVKFKVYIIRAKDQSEVDGALGLLNFNDNAKKNDAGKTARENESTSNGSRNRKQVKNHSRAGSAPPKQRESEVLRGSGTSGAMIPFQDVKNFEDFHVLVDGVSIDSQLSEETRKTYFRLCCSQNAYLHENVTQGMSSELIAGTISEIARISDAIRASDRATSMDDSSKSDTTLRAFQLLGMNVEFLRTRVRDESEEAIEEGRRVRALKVAELKEACRRFDAAIENLNSKAEIYELEFLKEAKAAW